MSGSPYPETVCANFAASTDQQIFPTQSVASSKMKPNLIATSRYSAQVATMSEQCRDAVENSKRYDFL